MLITLSIFALIIAWAAAMLRRGARSGMCAICGLLVFLPTSLKIDLPAGLPQMTIHRVLIAIAFLALLRIGPATGGNRRIPYLALLVLFGLSQGLSVVFGNDIVSGLKNYFSYLIEGLLYYVVVTKYIQSEEDVVPLLRGICLGLTGVALVAAVEKYLHFNLADEILPGDLSASHPLEDVTATYSHRILLGYAMAMGVPLTLAARNAIQEPRKRFRMFCMLLLLVAATYFSTSRGPWVGLALGGIATALLAGRATKRSLAVMMCLVVVVLVFRPGVRETIQSLYVSTFDAESAKGGSYQTRWQLWGIAWKEVQTSPLRLLFGFGPGSTESMDLTQYFYGQEGYTSSMIKIGFTSWDNNYACDLIELGIVGFAAEALLFATILRSLLQKWRHAEGVFRELQAGIIVACLIFMFAMTNVFIFAPQLKYLFWTLVAIGTSFSRPFGSGKPGIEVVALDLSAQPLGHDHSLLSPA